MLHTCPICKGEVINKTSSKGLESYCSQCRNILASATLGFTVFAEDGDEDTSSMDGNIEQCSVQGLPGWKGPGEKAKCYAYDPSDPESEERAKEKAGESAYMEGREAHIKKMAEPFFTSGDSPTVGLGTEIDEDGVPVQGHSPLNTFSSKREAIAPRNKLLYNSCSQDGLEQIVEPFPHL